MKWWFRYLALVLGFGSSFILLGILLNAPTQPNIGFLIGFASFFLAAGLARE